MSWPCINSNAGTVKRPPRRFINQQTKAALVWPKESHKKAAQGQSAKEKEESPNGRCPHLAGCRPPQTPTLQKRREPIIGPARNTTNPVQPIMTRCLTQPRDRAKAPYLLNHIFVGISEGWPTHARHCYRAKIVFG